MVPLKPEPCMHDAVSGEMLKGVMAQLLLLGAEIQYWGLATMIRNINPALFTVIILF